MSMKRLFLLLFLSCCFSGFLISQTYQDGVDSYNKANIARAMNDKDGERKELEKAHQIFRDLASSSDFKSLIMCYLTALKLEKSFSLQDLLIQYVKEEHPEYPTIEEIEFYGDDKQFIRGKIRNFARDIETGAMKLMDEAARLAETGDYQGALNKLSTAEKTWKSEKIALLKKQVRNNWYRKVINEARVELKGKNFALAMEKCDEAYGILPKGEALKLKKKIQRKSKEVRTYKGAAAFFFDVGLTGGPGVDTMNYHWTGNTTSYVDLSDRGSVKAEASSNQNAALSMGYMKLVSSRVGWLISTTLFRQEMDFTTDYTFAWTWWDGRGSTDSKTFSDTGTITSIPVNLDLLVVLRLGTGLSINFYAGPTLYLTSYDLNTRIGYGGVWYKSSTGYYYVEWFPFEYQIKNPEDKQTDALFGANFGTDIEYKVGQKIGFYLGFQYYFAPKKEYRWQLVSKTYYGEFDYFYVDDPLELDNLPVYKSALNLSTTKVNFGIKFYF